MQHAIEMGYPPWSLAANIFDNFLDMDVAAVMETDDGMTFCEKCENLVQIGMTGRLPYACCTCGARLIAH